MEVAHFLLLVVLFFLAAGLYASVGHAGASAYLAVMALCGIAVEVMRPMALVLNILVASIAAYQFYRSGYFSWSLFWPFAITSVPFAFLGGSIALPGEVYKVFIGLVLWYAAIRLLIVHPETARKAGKPPLWLSMLIGAVIGLLSGLVGVGGGIFLSPVLLLAGWANPKQTSAVAAVFILVNSAAGLMAQLPALAALPVYTPVLGVAVMLGGWLGAHYGSRRLGNMIIRRVLAAILVVASIKMVLPFIQLVIS